MSRLMSVSYTETAVRERRKTVLAALADESTELSWVDEALADPVMPVESVA
jgi:hypothetical protein